LEKLFNAIFLSNAQKKSSSRAQHQEQPGPANTQMKPRPESADKKHCGSGKVEGKVAIITGCDRGIGRAVAIAFAKECADMTVVYMEKHEDAEETERRVEEWGPETSAADWRRRREFDVYPGSHLPRA
jgi:hypothetical protein